jgi:hypothetical protein
MPGLLLSLFYSIVALFPPFSSPLASAFAAPVLATPSLPVHRIFISWLYRMATQPMVWFTSTGNDAPDCTHQSPQFRSLANAAGTAAY